MSNDRVRGRCLGDRLLVVDYGQRSIPLALPDVARTVQKLSHLTTHCQSYQAVFTWVPVAWETKFRLVNGNRPDPTPKRGRIPRENLCDPKSPRVSRLLRYHCGLSLSQSSWQFIGTALPRREAYPAHQWGSPSVSGASVDSLHNKQQYYILITSSALYGAFVFKVREVHHVRF